MNRVAGYHLALAFFVAAVPRPLLVRADAPSASAEGASASEPIGLFDAMEQGLVDAKFIAKSSLRGRIVMENKTDRPLSIQIPDAFIGVPTALAQFGGGGGGFGGGGGGFGGGGGQSQSVGGGGGGGGRGGRGGGGLGGGGGGRGGGARGGGRGAFNIAPEKTGRVEVDLLCLDHGLREPSAGKAYVIRPIENYISDPAVIELITAYGYGELPVAAAQAAVWSLNSHVSWEELASKLTGTKRQSVRSPYFTSEQIQDAMAIAEQARQLSAGKKVEPRPFQLPEERPADGSEEVSPGDESPGDEAISPGETEDATDKAAEDEAEASAEADPAAQDEATDATAASATTTDAALEQSGS